MVDRWEWVRRRAHRDRVRLLCDRSQLFEFFLALRERLLDCFEPMAQ